MFNMTNASKEFLKKHCPELLEEKDLRSFLIKLDDYIAMNGLDSDDEMTDFGYEAQAVYDEIFMCNEGAVKKQPAKNGGFPKWDPPLTFGAPGGRIL